MSFKKNQVLTATLVIALASAVFVNWYYKDSSNMSTENYESTSDNETVSGNLGDSVMVVAGTVEETTGKDTSTEEYFSEVKLNRARVNDEISDKINEILEINSLEKADKIKLEKLYQEYCDVLKWQNDAENLIYAKTGQKCIVVINSGSCQVIVDKNTLNDTIILQITRIIEENTNISAENLSIIEVK